jgi:hypothetical protein
MEGGRRHSSTRASRTKHPTSIKQDQLRRTSGADTPCPRPQNRPLDFFLIGCSEPYVPLVAAYGSSKPRGRAGRLRSPARVALKIRCRSRRTSRSQSDQSTQSQSTVSRPVSGARPSGPFTISAPNLSFGSSCFGKPFVKGSPAHVGALSRPGTRPGIRPVIRTDQRRADRPRSLSCRLSAAGIGFLGILYPPGLGPSLPPAYRHTASAWRTPTGFPCSARMRHDWGWVTVSAKS